MIVTVASPVPCVSGTRTRTDAGSRVRSGKLGSANRGFGDGRGLGDHTGLGGDAGCVVGMVMRCAFNSIANSTMPAAIAAIPATLTRRLTTLWSDRDAGAVISARLAGGS